MHEFCDELSDTPQYETWPTKKRNGEKFDVTETAGMLRWMCGFNVNERERRAEVRELSRVEPVNLVINNVIHRDGSDMLNVRMMRIASNTVGWLRLTELDRGLVQERLGGTVSRRI